MKKQLENLILELAIDLKKAGKQDTANYFVSISDKIVNTNNVDELKEILKQIMSSASIIQYGDFSFKQESIFYKIFEASKLYYESL